MLFRTASVPLAHASWESQWLAVRKTLSPTGYILGQGDGRFYSSAAAAKPAAATSMIAAKPHSTGV